jgi:hypothetical protein
MGVGSRELGHSTFPSPRLRAARLHAGVFAKKNPTGGKNIFAVTVRLRHLNIPGIKGGGLGQHPPF